MEVIGNLIDQCLMGLNACVTLILTFPYFVIYFDCRLIVQLAGNGL